MWLVDNKCLPPSCSNWPSGLWVGRRVRDHLGQQMSMPVPSMWSVLMISWKVCYLVVPCSPHPGFPLSSSLCSYSIPHTSAFPFSSICQVVSFVCQVCILLLIVLLLCLPDLQVFLRVLTPVILIFSWFLMFSFYIMNSVRERNMWLSVLISETHMTAGGSGDRLPFHSCHKCDEGRACLCFMVIRTFNFHFLYI